MQYYHRYISFWHLERYELCARDTNRNLRLFAFVREHARHTKDKLQFDQWRPYVTMMHARAVATPLVGLARLSRGAGRDRRRDRVDPPLSERVRPVAQRRELQRAGRTCSAGATRSPPKSRASRAAEPLDPLARLQAELEQAVSEERFEDAARLRDTIRQHSQRSGPRPGQRFVAVRPAIVAAPRAGLATAELPAMANV